ncbi:MAG: hypothetical protein ABGY24_18550 [bacterium]
MNHLTRAGKEALKQLSTRGFASGSELPSRKVAVLGAAGTCPRRGVRPVDVADR